MKLIPCCCFIFLLLSVLIPKETEAIDRAVYKQLAQLAAKQGRKLAKMSYYSKCPTVNVPRGMKCPRFVFGIGLSPNLAMSAAKIYATMFGGKQCAKYIGQCSAFQFTKQAGM